MSTNHATTRTPVRTSALCLVIASLALSASAQVTPIGPLPQSVLMNTLDSHINTFIGLNFAGSLSATTTMHAVVNSQSDKPALAALIADNWHVIDPNNPGFSPITGVGKSTFIALTLMPRLVNGAVVARVDWTLSGTTMTDYALVTPGATVGDTTAIQEGVTGWFTVPTSYNAGGSGCPSTFSQSFRNGFGVNVANFDANVDCFNNNCIGSASANASLPGCSAQEESSVRCVNNTCLLDYAFVGTCGFPSVSFSSTSGSFSVSGFGWSFFNASGTLCKNCNCSPVTQYQYQLNQESSELSIDGVIGTSIVGVTRPIGQPVTWNFDSSLTGNVWQIGVMGGYPLTNLGGATVTGEGQIFNLALASTSWMLPWGSATISGPTAFVHTPQVPMTVSAQMIVMDPTRPDGFALSGPGTLTAQ